MSAGSSGRRIGEQRRNQLVASLDTVQKRVQVKVLSTCDELDGGRIDMQLAQPSHELLVHVLVGGESVNSKWRLRHDRRGGRERLRSRGSLQNRLVGGLDELLAVALERLGYRVQAPVLEFELQRSLSIGKRIAEQHLVLPAECEETLKNADVLLLDPEHHRRERLETEHSSGGEAGAAAAKVGGGRDGARDARWDR